MQQLSSFTDLLSHHPEHAWLNAGSAIEGTLRCKGPVEIEGEVTGEIIAEGLLIIAKSAIINADITGAKIIVHGTVNGNISASESISLQEDAKFRGTLMAPALEIIKGACFEGKSFMQEPLREADPALDEPVESPVQDLQEKLQALAS